MNRKDVIEQNMVKETSSPKNIYLNLSQLPERSVRIGIIDAIDPQGGADTACQLNFESQVKKGKVIIIRIEISPGIFEEQLYLIPF